MTLSTVEATYQAIFDDTSDSILTPPLSEESDEAYFPTWVDKSMYSYNFIDIFFHLMKTLSDLKKTVKISITSPTFFWN